MLTGNLVLVRVSKDRVQPRFLNRDHQGWLEAAEALLLVFRNSVGKTRGEIDEEVEALVGEGGGQATLTHRGLAKVLEDRGEFEVVSDVPPDKVREKVFSAAATYRKQLRAQGPRTTFQRDVVLAQVGTEMGLPPEQIDIALFADLKDENRMLSFNDLDAQALLDRYNVALAQSVLLRSTLVKAEVRGQSPATYRHLFRMLKFHRLLFRVDGSMSQGYRLHIDGPLSLFSSTTRYGLQMAMFLPSLLLCRDYRLEAEVRWGPKREPRSLYLDATAGLVSHQRVQGSYVPAEVNAFIERFRQVATEWDVQESGDVIELGREGVWVPDYKFVHRATGIDVHFEVLGFWKRSSIERLMKLLPTHGPKRYVLAISDRLKVDEAALGELPGPVLRFKEVPNANDLRELLTRFL